MNRRAFLARSLRIPAAVAALPLLGGLATLAGTAEPEAVQTVEAEAPIYTLAADESWAPTAGDTRIMIWSVARDGVSTHRVLPAIYRAVRFLPRTGDAVVSWLGHP